MRQIVEVPVHAAPIHEQLDQPRPVAHEDVVHQTRAVRPDHHIGAQVRADLLVERQHVVIDVIHHDLVRIRKTLAFEGLQRRHHLLVVADHPAQLPLAEMGPQLAQEEGARGVAVLALGPLFARPPAHVRDRDGARRAGEGVVRAVPQSQAPNEEVGVGAHEGRAAAGRVPTGDRDGGWRKQKK